MEIKKETLVGLAVVFGVILFGIGLMMLLKPDVERLVPKEGPGAIVPIFTANQMMLEEQKKEEKEKSKK